MLKGRMWKVKEARKGIRCLRKELWKNRGKDTKDAKEGG